MARYRDAVAWIAHNDDEDLGDPLEDVFIVSIMLIADLWSKSPHRVHHDVTKRRRIDRRRKELEIQGEYDEEDRMMDDND